MNEKRKIFKIPSFQGIERAREIGEKIGARELFYRATTGLAALSLGGRILMSVAEALAVLLKTYRKFESRNFANIEQIINGHHSIMITSSQRFRESFHQEDEIRIIRIFTAFEKVLDPEVLQRACFSSMAFLSSLGPHHSRNLWPSSESQGEDCQ